MVDEGEKERRKFAKDFLEEWAMAERGERPVEEALKEVQSALELSDTDPGLWFRKGVLLSQLEKWDLALESLRKAESLDPALPRLQVALSFVLGKLGRLQEAAEANQRAIHAAAGAPEEEATVEQALKVLAEELREVTEAEAAEAQAVEGLEELVPLAKADSAEGAPGRTPEDRIAEWEAAGYDVTPLREVLRKDPDRVRTALFQFEQNLPKVQLLEETVKALDPAGLEADILRVRTLLRSPFHIWRIEAEVETLLEKADARDRTVRATRVPAPTPHPPAASRPQGAINGLAKGRVNGLVNGVQRARAGMTNGLTNGLGMTNGLGGRRFHVEATMRRRRLLLVPIAALLLLSVPLFVPPEEGDLGLVVIDGNFDEWQGMSRYVQDTSATNADVDLRGYAVWWEDNRLSLYANVTGTWFGDSTRVDLMHVFVDKDGNRSTGYDEGRIGADLLLEVHGGGEEILGQNAWSWPEAGADPDNWTAWQVLGPPPLANAKGSELELQIDLKDIPGFNATEAAMIIHTDDQQGSRASSRIAFGSAYGALDVQQGAVAATVQRVEDAEFVTLTFLAIGSDVTVSGLTFDPSTPPLQGFSPFTVSEGPPQSVTLSVDASELATSTLLTADLITVAADRPVVIRGAPARAYVAAAPAGKVVDGLFAEWNPAARDLNPVLNPNVDVERIDSEVASETAYIYVEVRGTALGGTVDPTVRVRPPPAQGVQPTPPAPPGVPLRQVGEDAIRVLFDTNATDEGFAVNGMLADAMLQIRGRNGRVRTVEGAVWRSGAWVRAGTAQGIAAGPELEGSLAVGGVDLRGAEYLVEARDWRGSSDMTEVGGVRGTRSGPDGITFFGAADAVAPAAGDGAFRFTRHEKGISWHLPEILASANGVDRLLARPESIPLIHEDDLLTYEAYPSLDLVAYYEIRPEEVKEIFLLGTPPGLQGGESLVLSTPFVRDADLLLRASGETTGAGLLVEGDLSFTDGHGLALVLHAPWALDSGGRRIDLRFHIGGDRIRITVPASWLAQAAYPITIDPTVTYTLHNNGPSDFDGENLGFSTAVGDFNGDGFADVLTGAPGNDIDGGTPPHGYAYIWFGPVSADDATPDVRIRGVETKGRFGWAVAAGMFNGDAYWDALVARLSAGSLAVNVSIYFGSASWSSLEETPDVDFPPPSSPQNFGFAIAAGNLDGANFDDVLIAEPGRDNNGDALGDGLVYVYKSPFSSVVSSANFTLFPSSNQSGQLGRGGVAVGKIDSDAYEDVIVGEPWYPSPTNNTGRVQFYRGVSFASGSGNRYPNATLNAQMIQERFGSAVSVGKLSGDAYEDIITGAPAKTVSGSASTGAAYVFLANSDGTGLSMGAAPSLTIANQTDNEQFGSAVLIVDGDPSPYVVVGAPFANATGTRRGRAYWFVSPLSDQFPDDTLTGGQDNERFGSALAGGRFSADTLSLVAIGAYLWDDGANDNDGRIILVQVPEPASTLIGTVILVTLVGLLRRRRRVSRPIQEV